MSITEKKKKKRKNKINNAVPEKWLNFCAISMDLHFTVCKKYTNMLDASMRRLRWLFHCHFIPISECCYFCLLYLSFTVVVHTRGLCIWIYTIENNNNQKKRDDFFFLQRKQISFILCTLACAPRHAHSVRSSVSVFCIRREVWCRRRRYSRTKGIQEKIHLTRTYYTQTPVRQPVNSV